MRCLSMENELAAKIESLKIRYFASKHIYIKNFLKFENIELPKDITPDSLIHWNQEKRAFLAAGMESMEGIKQKYISNLLNQLDTVELIQDKLEQALLSTTDTKEISIIVKSLDNALKMYNEIIEKLNIDSAVDTDFQDNKEKTDALLGV